MLLCSEVVLFKSFFMHKSPLLVSVCCATMVTCVVYYAVHSVVHQCFAISTKYTLAGTHLLSGLCDYRVHLEIIQV